MISVNSQGRRERGNQVHQRAEDTVIQIQGALVLARGLSRTEPFERILRQLPDELLKPA